MNRNEIVTLTFQERKDDFNIIHKGFEGDENEKRERIDEISTSKELLISRLGYFKQRKQEIEQVNEIYIHDSYQNEIFREFIASLKTAKIRINDTNYQELYELSQKYQYQELEHELKRFTSMRPDLVSVIDQLSSNSENDYQVDIQKEELISKNLDTSLKIGNLDKLPIQMLIRILNSPSRVLKNHHLLFEFVINRVKKIQKEKGNEEDIQFLVSCLDYCEMSHKEIADLFELFENNDQINLRNSSKCIRSLIEENEKKSAYICKLEERISKNETKTSDLQKLVESQGKIIDEQKKAVDELFKKIEVLNSKNEANKKEQDAKIQSFDEKLMKIKDAQKQEIQKILSSNKLHNKKQSMILPVFVKNYEKEPFSGIISQLSEMYSGNIHDKGVIEITGNKDSSRFSSIVDFKTGFGYYSKDEINSFICFDFKIYSISLSAYSIKSSACTPPDYLKSWNVEGSNDKTTWIKLDLHSNENALCSKMAIHTFIIKDENIANQRFRYIRLIMTDKSSRETNVLDITNIEFFGKCYKNSG